MADWDVTTAASSFVFDTINSSTPVCYPVDSTHVITFWAGSDVDGYVQVFAVNTSTWAVTTAADRLEFDTQNGSYSSCYLVDSTHFINFWVGEGNDGYVQVFAVNTSTWEVTTAAAWLEFDTQNGFYNNCSQIDSNHFINFWAGESNDGYVQVFAVNTSTWEVTTAADKLEFDTINGSYSSCYSVDSTHFINFWAGSDSDGYVQVFAVNTSTWAVTTAAARLEFDTVFGIYNNCSQIDSNHFINFWYGESGDGYVQVFAVNTSTWEVTTAADRLEFDTTSAEYLECCVVDSNHFVTFWAGEGGDGYVQVFAVNTSTWAVTTAADRLEFDTTLAYGNSCYPVDSSHFINFWRNAGGYVQVFTIALPSPSAGQPFAKRQIFSHAAGGQWRPARI